MILELRLGIVHFLYTIQSLFRSYSSCNKKQSSVQQIVWYSLRSSAKSLNALNLKQVSISRNIRNIQENRCYYRGIPDVTQMVMAILLFIFDNGLVNMI